MPTSPALAEGLAEPLLRLYLEAEATLLRSIARRLARGITEPGWAAAKLLEVHQLRTELEARVGRLTTEGRAAIEEAVRTAYGKGLDAALADLRQAEAAGAPTIASGFVTTPQFAVYRLAGEASRLVEATHFRVLRAATDAYREVVAEAAGQVTVGALTRRDAAQGALDRLLGRGITGFVDSAGRSWDMASYVSMAVRTATGHAAVAGHLDRLSDASHDLVRVPDVPRNCPTCARWEGRVLSITGRTPGYATVAEARGAGLWHANCKHQAVGAFLPGVTTLPEPHDDAAGYAASQQQRYLERQIRTWKTRESLALSEQARRQSAAKVRAWQARIRQHVAANDLRRLPYRESITRAR